MPLHIKHNNFDLIRLLAALQVVVHHGLVHFELQADYQALAWLSYFPGVPIIFVISGFLICASFERNPNLKQYFYNRFIRIFPALWVCFFVSVLSVVVFYSFDGSARNIVQNVVYFWFGIATQFLIV